MATIEFSDVGTICTASMTLPLENMDEHFGAPVAIGYYPGCGEIWIQKDGEPINIPVCHLKEVIKQLQRAAKLAKESGDGR